MFSSLPDRDSQFVEAVQGITEYVVTVVVKDSDDMPGGNPLIGATVAQIDLCNVPGVSLVKIVRSVSSHLGASTIPKPTPDFVLRSDLCPVPSCRDGFFCCDALFISSYFRAGDQLFFAGSVHRMLDITKEIDPGLEFVFGTANTLQDTHFTLMEATVGKQSKLVSSAHTHRGIALTRGTPRSELLTPIVCTTGWKDFARVKVSADVQCECACGAQTPRRMQETRSSAARDV